MAHDVLRLKLALICYLFWIGINTSVSLNCSLIRHRMTISGRFQLNTDTTLSSPVTGVASENICLSARNVTCCPVEVQTNLLTKSTSELKQLIDKVNNHLVTYIKEKRHQLRDHLISHLMLTESRVHGMFEENFLIVARSVRNAVQNLFRVIASYLNKESDLSQTRNVFNPGKFEKSVAKFYSSIFAPIFACVITQNCPKGYALTKNYTTCIQETNDNIKPFGNAVFNFVSKLEKSLTFANTSLMILDDLSDFINSTSSHLWANYNNEKACQIQLYRLYYCQLCTGKSNGSFAEICPAIMTQVLDQCLKNFKRFDDFFSTIMTQFKTFIRSSNSKEFDLEEKLISTKYDIQDVILNVTLNGGPEISSAIYRRCGAVQNEDVGNKQLQNKIKVVGDIKSNEMRIRSVGNIKFSNELAVMVQNLSMISKNWFGRMLVKIYETSEVATNANGTCWNGHAFVRYSKSLETLASAGGVPPQATNTLAANELDENFRRMSETLQTLEKLRTSESAPAAMSRINKQQQVSNVDVGSGDDQNHPPTDDDDYGDNSSGNGPVGGGETASSGDEENRISSTIRSDDEIALESISPFLSKSTTMATKKLQDKAGNKSSSIFHNKFSIPLALFLLLFFDTIRWLLWWL